MMAGGVPRDDVDRIFESYVSLRNRDDEDQGGYGLGLHVVKSFMKILGGKVRIDSSDSEGTVFVLTLPLAPVNHQSAPQDTIERDVIRPDAGLKLLAIDDEPDVSGGDDGYAG